MTIDKHTKLGIVERINNEVRDGAPVQAGELKVNEMTVYLEQKEMKPSVLITEEKRKYILDRCAISNSKMRNCHKLNFLNSTVTILDSNFFID